MMTKPLNPEAWEGLSLYRVLLLLTILVGGDSCLFFMGNEAAHPEWVELPSPQNNNSYKMARRNWSLLTDPNCAYRDIEAFVRALLAFKSSLNSLPTHFSTFEGGYFELPLGEWTILGRLFDGNDYGQSDEWRWDRAGRVREVGVESDYGVIGCGGKYWAGVYRLSGG